MKVIFFGNSYYSTLGAGIINRNYSFSLVVTTPDKPTGRDKTIIPSPVKRWALENKIKVLEADKLGEVEIGKIGAIEPDFLIVEDYGLILPRKLLELPKFAPLNIHHSLLPKFRGPSPAPSAILAGEQISGVTIIKMTDQVDAGDILDQKSYHLAPGETADTLLKKLNQLGGELMVDVLAKYSELEAKPQDNTQASYTKKMSKQEGYFEIDNPPAAEKLDRMIRAYFPWPTAWTRWKGKIVKFLPVTLNVSEGYKPDELYSSSVPQNDIGKLLVQMEGKKAVPLKDFLNGYPDFPIKTLS